MTSAEGRPAVSGSTPRPAAGEDLPWSADGLGVATESVLLLDEDLCIRCGLCVNRCPPGALSMVHAKDVHHA